MVSIIIRTKNEAQFIGRTLAAIRQQDYAGPVEIILVDSGSQDATVSLARPHVSKIISIPPEDFTFGYALNLGARAASGDVLVALSAHAIPTNPQWLSELVAPLHNPRVAAVASWQIPHPNEPLEPYLVLWQFLYKLGYRAPAAYRYMFSNTSSAFRAEIWRKYPFDEALPYCEDHYWAMHLQNQGYEIAHARNSVIYHSHTMPLQKRVRRIAGEVRTVFKMYWRDLVPARPSIWEIFES